MTGHEWTLPIDEVEARVLLPRGIPAASLEVRTGTRESLGREATAPWDAEGGALFRTTRPFRPGEGLTVILRWPKGFVPEPAAPRRWWWYFLGSNRSVLAGLAGLLLVLTYFVLAGFEPAPMTIGQRLIYALAIIGLLAIAIGYFVLHWLYPGI